MPTPGSTPPKQTAELLVCELLAAIAGHVLAGGHHVGLYERC